MKYPFVILLASILISAFVLMMLTSAVIAELDLLMHGEADSDF